MANYNQVGFGSSDKETVTKLQEMLNSTGKYNLETDGIFGSKTLDAVKNYQQENNLAVDGIVGTNTWGALTKASGTESTTPTTPEETTAPAWEYKPYTPSDTVKQAEALLQEQLAQKPGAYTSAWQTQLNDTLQKILNREKFSYDLNGDALYQQYKDQYTTQGKLAMMDTMGQAAAMTGGYGNSYAQTAGQQAYQGYLQQLNDKVPELYQLALSQYNAEGDQMYNQASLMAQMEDQDYGRYRDQMSDYYTEVDRLTNDSRYQAEQDYNKWADNLNFTYTQERDKIADQQWQAQFDEAKRQYDQQYGLKSSSSSSSNTGYTGSNDGDKEVDGPTNPGTEYQAPSGWDEAKVVEFQKKYGLDPDGVFGPKTEYVYDLINDLNGFISKGESKSKISAVLREELNSGSISKKLHDVLKNEFVPKGYTY